MVNVSINPQFYRVFINGVCCWFVFSDFLFGLWWRGISRSVCNPLGGCKNDTDVCTPSIWGSSGGESYTTAGTDPVTVRWYRFSAGRGLRNRTWKMRRLITSLACLTAWCHGSPLGPWCSAGWCPTSPSTGKFAGPRGQRGSPHTCAWFCWWPTSYGYSLGIK